MKTELKPSALKNSTKSEQLPAMQLVEKAQWLALLPEVRKKL